MPEMTGTEDPDIRHNEAAGEIRYDGDRDLFNTLIKNPEVIRACQALERAQANNPARTRRRLLAGAVLLTTRMARDLHRKAAVCVEKLGTPMTPELYVYPDSRYNAACFKPEDGNLLVMFSSYLLDNFNDSELTFVIGHELAHYAYRHHDLPVSFILKGGVHPDARLALDLFAWSRYAELSADRAGAYCAMDVDGSTKALFKLASGLSGTTVEFELADLLDQVEQLAKEDFDAEMSAPQADWFASHPFSPLRVKALSLYSDSMLYSDGGMSREALEVKVHGLMSLMEPSYLEGKSEIAESMRRFLFAAALTVANADDVISDEEIAIFEKFFGKKAFSPSLNLEQLSHELEGRARSVRELASAPQIIQVLRDLCIVSRAEGFTRPVEREVLDRVAHLLGVSQTFIDLILDGEFDPD